MNRTLIETQSALRAVATVESTADKQYVDVYVRESTNSRITGEATIRVTPEGFYDLVVPILKNHGITVADYEEAV